MYVAEKKIIRFAVMMICVALTIIYVIWYQVKGKHLNTFSTTTSQSVSDQQSGPRIVSDDSVENIYTPDRTSSQGSFTSPSIIDGTSSQFDQNTIDSRSGFNTVSTTIATSSVATFDGISIRSDDPDAQVSTIRMLRGTEIYLEEIEAIKRLSISYNYILRDDKNIFYVYLGDREYDFAQIARILGGTTFSLNTQEDIIKNQLFGESIQFINIPEYKDRIVLIYIQVNGQKWLLHIDYAQYHESKSYLKTLFID